MGASSRAVLALLIATLCCLTGQPSATAHADLVATYPDAGETLTAVPDQVVLEFATPLVAEQSRVLVRQPAGRAHPSQTMGSAAGEVLVTLLEPGGPDGAWTVAYEAVSTDGHTLTGTVAFSVGGAASPGATAEAGTGGLGWMFPLLGAVLVAGFSSVVRALPGARQAVAA